MIAPEAIKDWLQWKIANMTLSNIDAIRVGLDSGIIDGVCINNYPSPDIEILCSLPKLRAVVIVDSERYDLLPVEKLAQLELLSIGVGRTRPDLRALTALRAFSFDWIGRDHLPATFEALFDLRIWKYKSPTQSLAELPRCPNVTTFCFTQSSIVSLEGIEQFQKLETIDLAYLPRLTSLAPLAATPVEVIKLTSCRKIDDLSVLSACRHLRVIQLNGIGEIPSLRILDKFKALEEFRFVNTNVIDGDMTPLLRLKQASFLNKRHFSHTSDEVEAITARSA